jgi:hypothetical protein
MTSDEMSACLQGHDYFEIMRSQHSIDAGIMNGDEHIPVAPARGRSRDSLFSSRSSTRGSTRGPGPPAYADAFQGKA